MCSVIGDAGLQSRLLPKNLRIRLTYTHKTHCFLDILLHTILQFLLHFSDRTLYFHRQTLMWTKADNSWASGLPWCLGSTMYKRHNAGVCKLQHGGRKGGGEYSWVSSATYGCSSSFFSLRNIKNKKILFFSHITALQYALTVVLVYIPLYNLLNLRTSFYFQSILLLRS